MEYNDVEKLFNLLEHLYQGKKKSRDKVTVAIWHEVFKPWSYEQVRDAVIRRSREKKFMPDQSEIAEYLPKVDGGPKMGRPRPPSEWERSCLEQSIRWQEQWHEDLQRRGLPTMREALERGMSLPEWRATLIEAGVWK